MNNVTRPVTDSAIHMGGTNHAPDAESSTDPMSVVSSTPPPLNPDLDLDPTPGGAVDLPVDIAAWDAERIINDFPTAAAEASAVLDAALAAGDRTTEAQARLVLATAQTYLELHQSADAHFRIAARHFAELGDLRGELYANGRHAMPILFLGDAEAAEQQLLDGLTRARRLGDRRVLIEHLTNLAYITGNAQRHYESISYLVECRALAQREQWTFAHLMSGVNLSGAYIGLHDYESAALTCRESLEIIGDNAQYATLRSYFVHHLATTEQHTGHTAAAIRGFAEVADMATARNDLRTAGMARLDEARLRRSSGDETGALAAYRQADAMWRTHAAPPAGADTGTDTDTGTGTDTQQRNDLAVLSRWGVEALTGTWKWDTVRAIETLLKEGRPPEKEGQVHLHDALAESYRGLGDYPAAFAQHARCIAVREEIWNETLHLHAYASAKAEQTREARQRADTERWRREAADRTLEQMQALNAKNALLIQRLQEQTVLLAELSHTDDLTGLSNRRHFHAHVRKEMARAEAFDRPLTVGLADIDDFKQVNDEWSHATGDRVLRHLARVMRGAVRETDMIARHGGEEFALLLPETTLAEGVVLAERLRLAVETYPWDDLVPGMSITMSIGLWPATNIGSVEEALARADEQMYRAKRAGKNPCRRGPLAHPHSPIRAARRTPHAAPPQRRAAAARASLSTTARRMRQTAGGTAHHALRYWHVRARNQHLSCRIDRDRRFQKATLVRGRCTAARASRRAYRSGWHVGRR